MTTTQTTISIPAGGAVSAFKTIKFPEKGPSAQPTLSNGKNGAVITTGVHIYSGHPDYVELSPITSRNRSTDACIMGIARDKVTLLAIAAELSRIADTL